MARQDQVKEGQGLEQKRVSCKSGFQSLEKLKDTVTNV